MTRSHINFKFLEPWIMNESQELVRELEKEVNRSHILFGINLRTVARRIDQDDVLYQIVNDPGKYVEVHLTWAKNESELWPRAKIYNTFDEWIINRMNPNNAAYI